MSVQISSEMIKELRERTGVGIGKCKEALEKTNGDMEAAIDLLRKMGIATAVKKEGRTANEGMIGNAQSPHSIAVIEVNSETDFVAKNDRFQEFLKNVSNEAASTAPASLDTFIKQKYSKDKGLSIDEYRATVVQAIGENIQIRRLQIFKKDPNRSFGVYSHLGGKIVTVVELIGSNTEENFARDIAMHVAAASPDFLSPEQVPSSIVEHEKGIARDQIKGKPENIIEKIVTGKISAFYDAVCLIRQKYIKDDTMTIANLVEKRSKEIGKPLSIGSYIYWAVGQG